MHGMVLRIGKIFMCNVRRYNDTHDFSSLNLWGELLITKLFEID